MNKPSRKKLTTVQIVAGLVIIIQTVLFFVLQNRNSFMLEDMDYLYLSTGEKLSGLGDVFKSIPEIMKVSGGSGLSIFILKLTLLMGPKVADVINTFVMLLACFLIIRVSKIKRNNNLFFALAFVMFVALNSDWQYSYMLQFYVVNFFYPVIPFLIFFMIIVGELEDGLQSASLATGICACICAFLCAWGNGAYGLVTMGIAGIAILLQKKMLRSKAPIWMFVSTIGAALGCILYLASSGNFTKAAIMNGAYLSLSIFPAVILALVMVAVSFKAGGFLTIGQMVMIGGLGCAIVINFLIMWIPGVSENGIKICVIVLAITLFISLLHNIIRENPKHKRFGYILGGVFFVYSVLLMLEQYSGVM